MDAVAGGREADTRLTLVRLVCLGRSQEEDPIQAFAYRVILVALMLVAPLSMIVLSGLVHKAAA